MKRTILGLAISTYILVAGGQAVAGESLVLARDKNTSLSRVEVEVTLPEPERVITDVAYPVEKISYSSETTNFYFWLDGYAVAAGDSQCASSYKFGIRTKPQNEGLIEQVKMAFLSGRKIFVQWYDNECVGGAPGPHYIKTIR